MSNSEDTEIRYCKKCGCELASTNKHKLCDDCRRKRAEKIRNGAIGIGTTLGSVVLFVVTKGKHGGGGNKA
jgi:hypothetical protein